MSMTSSPRCRVSSEFHNTVLYRPIWSYYWPLRGSLYGRARGLMTLCRSGTSHWRAGPRWRQRLSARWSAVCTDRYGRTAGACCWRMLLQRGVVRCDSESRAFVNSLNGFTSVFRANGIEKASNTLQYK